MPVRKITHLSGCKDPRAPLEHSFSDWTLNEWLEILISTPKHRNSGQIPTPNAWNYYPSISLFRLMSQFGPTRALTTGISQENKPQTSGRGDFQGQNITPNHSFFCSNVYL